PPQNHQRSCDPSFAFLLRCSNVIAYVFEDVGWILQQGAVPLSLHHAPTGGTLWRLTEHYGYSSPDEQAWNANGDRSSLYSVNRDDTESHLYSHARMNKSRTYWTGFSCKRTYSMSG